MLTAGQGQNGGLVWSHDGKRVAYHSTARDGVSYDLMIAEPANTFAAPRLVFNGFQKSWSVLDWSPDDTKLLINNFVSANEIAPVRHGHRDRGADAGQRGRRAGRACRRRVSRRTAAACISSPIATANSSSCAAWTW